MCSDRHPLVRFVPGDGAGGEVSGFLGPKSCGDGSIIPFSDPVQKSTVAFTIKPEQTSIYLNQ